MRLPSRHISLAGAVVVISVVAAIAVVVWVLLLVRDEESPVDPPPEPTVSPLATPATPPPPGTVMATPVPNLSVEPAPEPGSLSDLLRYAPDRLADDTLPLSDIARYADIKRWMDAGGVEIPDGPQDRAWEQWETGLGTLALPEVLAARANDPLWDATYGFQLTDVDQVLAVGQAPDYVLIMRGDFEPEALHAAWVQSGYQAVRAEDVTIWSLFPGDAVDLSAPASRPALGNLNNIVLLDDGTLIATSRLSRLEDVVRVAQEDAPSLDDNPAVAALLAPGAGAESMVTAVIVKGSLLATVASTPTVIATPFGATSTGPLPISTPSPSPIADLQMPPVELMLAGIEAPGSGGTPPVFSMVLSFDAVEDATRAMISVDRTLQEDRSPVTHRSYRERLEPLQMRVIGTEQGDALLLIRTGLLNGSADWLVILEERDLGFLMWPLELDDE
ncbi:MAG TPA: hypothetical protein VGR29_04490 [Thermomicrobiales bacterium]|nr:hypothetical protein [Thermomicrobiales bacterium]